MMLSKKQMLPGLPLIESPLFPSFVADMDLSESERTVAEDLYRRGYAVIDFPDPTIAERIDRIKNRLAPMFAINMEDPDAVMPEGDLRIQDAWQQDEDVRAIACNTQMIDLLSKLYGRPAFPFQTLNFPVGTQQHMHSDSIHFSSLPERFMCGVWLAMEDIGPESGPLIYYPGSHKWPIVSNEMLQISRENEPRNAPQAPYEPIWRSLIEQAGIEGETFHARKGQALIWLANLLHGGSTRTDLRRTRWSQVTHYYFEGCTYYTPAYSEPAPGRIDTRHILNIATGDMMPNMVLGKVVPELMPPEPILQKKPLWRRLRRRLIGKGRPRKTG
ncbi:phytanoyl-CoA dioxygenase family protein [Sphingomonas bisphenolicum]